jgi:hypothetical protein
MTAFKIENLKVKILLSQECKIASFKKNQAEIEEINPHSETQIQFTI